MLTTAMAPITLALGGLMISRVPYPSFKTITVHKRAQIELTIGVLMVAALLFAMPQLTAFLLSAAFVLSGPFLMLRGECSPRCRSFIRSPLSPTTPTAPRSEHDSARPPATSATTTFPGRERP